MAQTLLQSGKVSDLIKKPLIMGILNVTPDSFSDGGKYFEIKDAIPHIKRLIEGNVDIIDVGGESTRPGATFISHEEELRRVIPVIDWCREAVNGVSIERNIFISIDTYKSNVARKAIEAGANMINDVSGLTMDPNMACLVAKLNCSIVIMHNRGIPATKPVLTNSKIVSEVYSWLQKQTQYATSNSIKKKNIIIDVGIGFGKTPEEDLELIQNLKAFKSLGFPILVGISKKSFMKKIFGVDKTKEMIELAVKNGADIIRVHF